MEGNLLAPTNGMLYSYGNTQVNQAPKFPSLDSRIISFGNDDGGNTNDTYLEEKALISRINSDTLRLNEIRTQRLFATGSVSNSTQLEDNAIRKQFIKSQDIILRNFLYTMETCKALGFVYGLISKEGKVVTGSSENMRSWWQEKVRFHQSGPMAIADYFSNISAPGSSTDKPEVNFREKLMEISDTTLGSLLSALMQHCIPPQRHNPLDKGLPPRWWPTKKESWWTELGFPSDIAEPPYKKPHDLRKIWKTAVLIAVIKNISPDTAKIRAIISQYKGLQDKMTAKELQAWSSALEQVDRDYRKNHPNAPLCRFNFRNFNSNANALLINEGLAPTNNAQIVPQGQISMNRTWSFNQNVQMKTENSLVQYNSSLSQQNSNMNLMQNTAVPSLQDIQQQLNNGFCNPGYQMGNLNGNDNNAFLQAGPSSNGVGSNVMQNMLEFKHQGNMNDGGYCYPENSMDNMDICNNLYGQSAPTPSNNMQFTESFPEFDSLDDFLRQR